MSSVSAIFGIKLSLRVPLTSSAAEAAHPRPQSLPIGGGNGGGGLAIECSSRPQKKATAHHRKTRPRKTNPSDRRHGPPVYAPLPPLPAEWSLVSDDSAAATPPQQIAVQSE